MKKSPTIRTNEWLDALSKAEDENLDPTATGIREAMAHWNLTYYMAKSRLDRAVKRGELVKTQKRSLISGQVILAYKPAPKGKK